VYYSVWAFQLVSVDLDRHTTCQAIHEVRISTAFSYGVVFVFVKTRCWEFAVGPASGVVCVPVSMWSKVVLTILATNRKGVSDVWVFLTVINTNSSSFSSAYGQTSSWRLLTRSDQPLALSATSFLRYRTTYWLQIAFMQQAGAV